MCLLSNEKFWFQTEIAVKYGQKSIKTVYTPLIYFEDLNEVG